eukprot:snap_masked-scaffold_78-processed-gene-0.41-mRNA-1 protein AED:1.00 eAED:1.00 QI:0/-1/0/0/-1/1/1/0/431
MLEKCNQRKIKFYQRESDDSVDVEIGQLLQEDKFTSSKQRNTLSAKYGGFEEALFQLEAVAEKDLKPKDSWTIKQRRKYMNNAFRKHYNKIKDEDLETFISCVSYDAEIFELEKQKKFLTLLYERLKKSEDIQKIKIEQENLLRVNEILRKRNMKHQREIYMMGKFMRLADYFPTFDAQQFQKNIGLTLAQSLNMFKEYEVNKYGDISFLKQNFKAIKNRTKIRKEINQKVKKQKNIYGTIFFKSIVCDKSKSALFCHEVRVENVDFIKYSDAFYTTLRYNKYDAGIIKHFFDIEYDVSHFDSLNSPFFSAFFGGQPLEFQRFNLSVYKPKIKNPTARPFHGFPILSACFTALYRSENFSIIMKSAILYDQIDKKFLPGVNSLSCILISKVANRKNTVVVKSISSHTSPSVLAEWVSLYQGVNLAQKIASF